MYSKKFLENSNELNALLKIEEDGTVLIGLIEYGRNQVKCSYNYDSYNIIMLDSNKNKRTLDGTMYEGGNAIEFYYGDEQAIISALKGTGEVSFYIEDAERTTTNYLFTVQTSNFKDLYENM